jgi:hypothetical protein
MAKRFCPGKSSGQSKKTVELMPASVRLVSWLMALYVTYYCSSSLWNALQWSTLGKFPPKHTHQPTLADLFHAL